MKFDRKKLETCVDDSLRYEYRLERTVDETTIRALAKEWGSLQYFPSFPRPFYRIKAKGGLQVSGVQGEMTFELVVSPPNIEEKREFFEQVLGSMQLVVSPN